MLSMYERQKDILSIIDRLDISPTMYDNAVKKYEAITQFLIDNGIKADMYPQGSFAVGTVTRPYSKDNNAAYDLDCICQVDGNRDDTVPADLRNRIQKALESNEIYKSRLIVEDECFTIKYADCGDAEFSIDIVPAVDESSKRKEILAKKCKNSELINTAIAIPKFNTERDYEWLTNNPKGFQKWFNDVNEPFMVAVREQYRQKLFENNATMYASVEEIPSQLERSSLQRVIQILKYHRNKYYKDLDSDLKPISAILNTVVARIADGYDRKKDCGVFELLEFVLDEFEIYSKHQKVSEIEFKNNYGARSAISYNNKKWNIANPANPEDNLADKWNSDARIPMVFFKWIATVKYDLVEMLRTGDDQAFGVMLENAFGSQNVTAVLGKKYVRKEAPQIILPQTAPKPYCKV